MKKLLFVLAFTFIGQQVFSQIYLLHVSSSHIGGCTGTYDYSLTKVDPLGNETYTCIDRRISQGALINLNTEINSIITLGYKLIRIPDNFTNGNDINNALTFVFAIP